MSMNFGTNLLPTANKTYVLGSNAKKWDDIQTDKINGIDAGTLRGNDIIKCETSSFSSLPQTFQDARVTADHELVQEGFIYLSNPSAMAADDWKVTTSNGSYTISGTINGTTTAKFGLSIPCTHTEPDLLQLQQNVASLNSQVANQESFINNGSFSCSTIQISSTTDNPIIIKETGNEDYKGIVILDASNVIRYNLLFIGGHLYFKSWDSNGNQIVDTKIV